MSKHRPLTGAERQRMRRKRKRESIIVLPMPLHVDIVRELLVRAGVTSDMAERDRRAAGKVLADLLESLDLV